MTTTIVRRAALAAAVAALTLGLSPALRAQDAIGIALGAKAPGAAVEALDGRPVDLAQYIGKSPVLLEFWATWCPVCKEMEPEMLTAVKKYGSRVKFIAVAVSVNESPDRIKRYVAKYHYTHEVVFDRDGHATDAYDVPATSYIVVIDKSGKVVYTGQGAEQNIEAALRKVL